MTKQELVNTVNQITYIGQHRKQLIRSGQQERQFRKLSRLNKSLINELIDSLSGKYAPKTIQRHQLRLDAYLNEYLAPQLLTVFDDYALKIERVLFGGFTYYEVKGIKTALKKLYQFLFTAGLIDKQVESKCKKEINQQLKNCNESLSVDCERLLNSYCIAMSRAYGLIPCDQAFRIIVRQNPSRHLTARQFQSFIAKQCGAGYRRAYYIICAEGIPVIASPLHIQNTDELYESQMMQAYRVPAKKQLLKLSNFKYLPGQAALEKYSECLKNELNIATSGLEHDYSLFQMINIFNANFFLSPIEIFDLAIKDLENNGRHFRNQASRERFITVLTEVSYNIPQQVMRGYDMRAFQAPAVKLSILALMEGKTKIDREVTRALEKGTIDPNELVSYLHETDDLDVITKQAMIDQINALGLPSLDDEYK